MGTGAERIAFDITATANVAEVTKARSEVSALGDAAKKAADLTRQAFEEAGGDLTKMAQIYARLTGQVQQSTVAADRNEAAIQRQGMAMARAEQAAYRMNAALEMQQRRMAQLHDEALRMNEAFDETAAVTGEGGGRGISHSAARGLGELGRGLAQVAQTGQLSAFSLREFTGAAFRLGAEIGPTGLGAAIGLSVLAIGTLVEAFSKSGEAAKKANQEFQSYIETLVHGSVVEASLAKARLYSGDPTALITGQREGESDIAFHARAGGQQFLEAEQARIQAQFDALQAVIRKRPHGEMTAKESSDWSSIVGQLKEINQLLNANDAQLARVSGVYDYVLTKQKDIEKFQLDQMRDRQARRSVATAPIDRSELSQRGRAKLLDTLSDIDQSPGNLTYLDELRGKELELEVQLHRTNLTYSERLRLQHEFSQTENAISAYGRVDTSDKAGGSPFRIRAADLKKIGETAWERDNLADLLKFEELRQHVEVKLGNTLADGLAGGIRAGFRSHSIQAAFKAGSGVILAGLGGMLIDEGKVYLEKAAIMEALVPHLFNPITSGWAAAGIGAALIGLGATLEALGSGGGGGGSGAGGGFAGSGSTFTPNAANAGAGTTVIIQTIDPLSRGVVQSTIYEINRSGMLNTPIVAPYGRPS